MIKNVQSEAGLTGLAHYKSDSKKDHVKLLVVNLDSKLNFEIHIQQICFKAGNHLNVLKRLSTFINCKDRKAIFRSLILCHFEFCSVVWHFCGETSIRRKKKYRREPYALCTESMIQHTLISYTRQIWWPLTIFSNFAYTILLIDSTDRTISSKGCLWAHFKTGCNIVNVCWKLI